MHPHGKAPGLRRRIRSFWTLQPTERTLSVRGHSQPRPWVMVRSCILEVGVSVAGRLTPTSYTWNFGDGRTGSVRSYAPEEGLGRPYTDAVHASPVQWSYEFDSRDFASGFPIKLRITFSAAFQANGSGWQGLPN